MEQIKQLVEMSTTPKTDIFHRLDDVIGNSMDGRATDADVIAVAVEANRYLVENPHPDSLLPEDSDKRVAAREALDKRLCDVKKEHAVEFTDWVSANGYAKYPNLDGELTWFANKGRGRRDITTSALYELFLETKEK